MRIGLNPHKDKLQKESYYIHQVVIPVYIPCQEGYFKDSLRIFQLCLDSLLNTVHSKTYITVVNNGSCKLVIEYLDKIYRDNQIQELIHTENIGKLNAVLKGLAGNNIELVTISDADVLFLPNWQSQTVKVFNKIPSAGVVGIVPQFKMYESNCGTIIFDNLFNKKLQCIPVKNPNGLIRFYESIGWDTNYNRDYLKYSLGYKVDNVTVYVGSGHFVATYKKDMFQEMTSFIGYKMGGSSEEYLDKAPLIKGYWRVTTHNNYAYHMGNTLEDWMKFDLSIGKEENKIKHIFRINKRSNSIVFYVKNRLFVKFISIKWMVRLFLKWKNLPKGMIEKY